MHRAAVCDENIIHAGAPHFMMKRFDVSGRHERIIGAVQHQNFRLYVLCILWSRRVEPAMKAHDSENIRTASRQFQDCGTPETISDRRDSFRINLRVVSDEGQRRVHTLSEQLAIAFVLVTFLHHQLLRFWAHVLSIHVGAKRSITETRDHLRALLFVFVESVPIVKDDHRRASRLGVVVDQVAFHFILAVQVRSGDFDEVRPSGSEGEEQESEHDCFHFLYFTTLDKGGSFCDTIRPLMNLRSRFLGCLLGGAVGDALGAPVEFMKLDQIKQRYGDGGIRDFVRSYGRIGAITDDTQMTLFTAEGVIRSLVRGSLKGICDPYEVMRRAYLRWYITQGGVSPKDFRADGWLITQKKLFRQRAPGVSVMNALSNGGYHPNDPPANDSWGSGGLMRVAPVGLLMESPFAFGCKTAAITHGHPMGQVPAGCLAVLIRSIIEGAELRDAINEAGVQARKFNELVELLDRAVSLAESDATAAKAIHSFEGGGWMGPDALGIAIFACLRADNFEEAVIMAVNHDGDSDTTGSIAGQIMGALSGVEAIPARWVENVELKDVIEQVALDLYVWHESPPSDEEIARDWWVRYPGS